MQRSFQRNTRDRITKLKESGNPAVLDAEAYQKLLDNQQLLESIESISRGLQQAKREEGRPMRDLLQTLAHEHGFSLAD